MIDDNDTDSTPAPVPAWCNPTRAKGMLHGTALFVRDMLTHDRIALFETYGIRPDEAAQSLRYVELAELRVWGIEEMLEAAAAVPNQASTDSALRRRIIMALKAEAAADFVHPGDAVLLMERSGLMLSSELREAVVFMSAGSHSTSVDFFDDDENRLRRLLGRPVLPDILPKDDGEERAPQNVSSTACKERREKLDIKRERGARRRILELWNDIEALHGADPDAHQVLRVLNRQQGEDAPALKTVQNRLIDLRRDGLIP